MLVRRLGSGFNFPSRAICRPFTSGKARYFLNQNGRKEDNAQVGVSGISQLASAFSEVKASSTDAKPSGSLSSKLNELLEEDSNMGALNDLMRATANSTKQAEAADLFRKEAQPVLDHITGLDSNNDVIQFFLNDVTQSFETKRPLNIPGNIIITKQTLSLITEHVISILTNRFNDAMGALYVFATAKQRSSKFYHAACKADVYNLIFALKWKCYRELRPLVALVSEMFINAIPGNNKTIDLISAILREAATYSKRSDTNLALWSEKDHKDMKALRTYQSRLLSTMAARKNAQLVNNPLTWD